jgi:outer membrane protein TolC
MRFQTLLCCAILVFGGVRVAVAQEIQTLTWEDCVKEASRNNPSLAVAVESVYQARAAKAITVSGVYPQLDASATADESKSKIDSQKTTTADSYSYGLSGSLLIFDGLKSSNSVKAAAQNISAAQESYRFSSASVRLQLRTAFVSLLEAQDSIGVTQEIVKIREDELKLITLRYQSGLEHKGSLMDNQASMTKAKFNLEQAVRNLKVAQKQLNVAMGRKDFVPLKVQGEYSVAEDSHQVLDFKALAQNHPSVKQAVAKERSADFSARAARGNFLPQVSVQAGADRNGSQWPVEDSGLSVGLTVSMPIFEGGLRNAQVSQADSVLRQAEAQLQSTQDSVALSLEQAWESFREAAESVEEAKVSLAANVERSTIAEAQYSTGFITYDNWSIIEDNLVQSKMAYLNAQANALLAEAQWVNAKGETLEYANQ